MGNGINICTNNKAVKIKEEKDNRESSKGDKDKIIKLDEKDQKKEDKNEEEETLKSVKTPQKIICKQHVFKKDGELVKQLKNKFSGGEVVKENLSPDSLIVLQHFDKFDKWDFDLLRISKLTNGFALYYVTLVFMIKYDLFEKQTTEKKFMDFVEDVQLLNNNNNPFYNCDRVASVLHSFHFMLRKGLKEYIGDTEIFSSVIACLCVYLDHPGLDNSFQSNAESYLSTIYNDMSILENTASYQVTKLVFEKDENHTSKHYGILELTPKKNRKEIREIVLDMIVATDEEFCEQYIEGLKLKLEGGSDFSSKEDIRFLLQSTIYFCTLDYCYKITPQYKDWVKRKMVQTFCQGDLEKEVGHRVRSFRDRDRNKGKKICNYYYRFLDKKAKPLIKTLLEAYPRVKFFSSQIRKNKDYWNHKFKKEENVDFDDIHEYKLTHLKEAQERFEKKYRMYKVPTNQVKNVSIEVQEKQLPRPTKEDSDVHKECFNILKKRFSIQNIEKRKPFQDVAPYFAASDFENNQVPTKEERIDCIVKMFDRIDEYNFDVFCLQKLMNDDIIVIVTFVLFVKYDFINTFKIPEKTLINFLKKISSTYQRNDYHNGLHAVDVMQVTNCICSKGGVIDYMTSVDMLAAIVSSLVHDLDHPGLNDAFQVHSFSYLAKLYNDRSVLEAHHCAEAFRIIRDEDLDIFQGMTVEEKQDCRKTMVKMIISTDMCNHAKYVKSFNKLIESESKFTKKDDIRVALEIVIKMADISNPSRPTFLYLQWTNNLLIEFFRQGDKEKLYELPISPLMDREKSVISKGQMAFMEYVIIPMFKSFQNVFPKMKFTIDNILTNKEFWKKNSVIQREHFNPTPKQREPIQQFIVYKYKPSRGIKRIPDKIEMEEDSDTEKKEKKVKRNREIREHRDRE